MEGRRSADRILCDAALGAHTIGVAPPAMGAATLLTGERELRAPVFSADGAWIAAVSATDTGDQGVFVSRTPAPGAMLTPIGAYVYPGAIAFTQGGMLATIAQPRNGPEIVVHPVPSNSEVDHVPLPANTRVWAMAAEPNGDRVVLHVLPSWLSRSSICDRMLCEFFMIRRGARSFTTD